MSCIFINSCGCIWEAQQTKPMAYCDEHDPLKEHRAAIARELEGISLDIKALAMGNALIQGEALNGK